MAEVALYLLNPATNKSLYFDVVRKYSLSRTWNMTEHPVEGGATVSDHVQKQPAMLTIDAFISRTPFSEAVRGQGTGNSRITFANAFLRDASGVPMVIVTHRHGTLSSMILTRAQMPIEGGGGCAYTLELKELVTATAELVTVSVDSISTATDSDGNPTIPLNEGEESLVVELEASTQPTTTVSAEEEAAEESYLHQLASWAGLV